MTQNNEVFIQSILGNDLQVISLTVNEKIWQGWKRASFKDDVITRDQALLVEAQRSSVIKLVEHSWQAFHAREIRLWSHFGVDIFAIPDMPVLDILEYEQVAQHKAHSSESSIALIYESLAQIFRECPFEIIFADSAGLEATFLNSVNRPQAEKLQELIYSIALDSMNLMFHELYGSGDLDMTDPRLSSIAIDYILQKQKLRLYWD